MAHKSRAHKAVRPPKQVDRARRAFRRSFKREPGNVGPTFSVTPNPQKALDRAALPHFWHPDRHGVVRPPSDFAARLTALHPDLRLTRPPVLSPVYPNCWLLWVRKSSIQHPLCPGWLLLMPWVIGVRPLPLDERLFAAIAHFDRRRLGENGVQYFDRIIAERDAARAKARAKYLSDVKTDARDFMESTKIKNIGRGNKFARHHDGTIIPSRGDQNWAMELDRNLPARVRRDIERRRDT